MVTIPDKTVFDADIADQLEDTTRVLRVERPGLIVLEGGEVNRRIRIDQPEMFIGRDRTCDIVLLDDRCSRRHSRLVYNNFHETSQPPQIVLVDNQSTNGTFVNGVRLAEPYLLKNGDKVMLGSSVLGFFLRDESELEADQKLYHLANYDSLTDLHNRRFFDMEFRKEFERARRYTRQLSLVIFDIDHFKRFNDTYGHQVGDFVLRELGAIARANTRNHDVGARYGGEEFAIILPETAMEGALIQAERLRVAVQRHHFTNDETSFTLSVSLGIASLEEDMVRPEMLIQAADRALYQAKAEGRNCICWYRNGVINAGNAGTATR